MEIRVSIRLTFALNAAVQKFGALADRAFLPQPTDPDLQNKLAGVLKTMVPLQDYLKKYGARRHSSS